MEGEIPKFVLPWKTLVVTRMVNGLIILTNCNLLVEDYSEYLLDDARNGDDEVSIAVSVTSGKRRRSSFDDDIFSHT
jgi:hypothetical protein